MCSTPAHRLRVSVLLAAAVIALTACRLSPAAEAPTAGFHHVGLNLADPQAAAAWYARHLGGKILPEKSAPVPAVAFGKTTIRFFKAVGAVAGSVGSGVDHIGFSYADLDAAMKRFRRDGVKIVSEIEQDGPIRYAFIKDPWGTLIEVVQDPELLGFHHIHLATTNPKAMRKWYLSAFGGKPARFYNLIGGVRYGDVWVLIKTFKRPLAPTKGRAIDHVSWDVADLQATIQHLRAKGTKIEAQPTSAGPAPSAFVAGPDGVRIELVQRQDD